jgi:hypothetical protein
MTDNNMFFIKLEQWFLTFLALLPLELANKSVITPLLSNKYEKKEITKW